MRARLPELLISAALLATTAVANSTAADDATGDTDGLALAQNQIAPELTFFHDAGTGGGSGVSRELVGLLVNGRETADGLEILRSVEGGIRLPLRALAAQLRLNVADDVDGLRLETPLGTARFGFSELRISGQEAFAPMALVASRLAADIRFDENNYAVTIDLRWSTNGGPGTSPQEPIQPDVLAPGADLSRLRGSLWHHRDDDHSRSDARIEAAGRLGPGTWQVRYLDTSVTPGRFQDYHWRVRSGQWSGLVGHQLVGTHPLLPAFDLTGAQAAWTNAPERLYSPLDPDRLVADRPGAVRTLRGQGTPGGVAELRIDDRVVERQRIPLDGWFEFVSVPMPSGYARVEVMLYDTDVGAAAESRIDFSDRASDRLLGAGEYLVHGGFGRNGNPLDELREGGGTAGFLRGRTALGQRVTVEATAQSTDNGGDHVLAGADVNLGRTGVVSLAGARGDAGNAWLAGIDGGGRHWFWRGYALERDAGFNGVATPALSERSGEFGWRLWPYAELSLVGRQRREEGLPDIDFVKPAARVRPLQGVQLSARPDFEGHYVYDAEWLPARNLRASAHRDRQIDQVQVDYRFAPAWQASAAVTRDRDLDRRRDSVIVSFQEPVLHGWTAELGVLHSEGDYGMLARAGRELLPGVQFRFETRRDPLYRGRSDRGGTIASLGLLFDLGRAGGRFTRASSAARGSDGAIAGGIVVDSSGMPAPEGVVVRIDGQPRVRTDGAGRFHVGGLKPGVYRVEIDEEGLPIELSVAGSGRWAQVAAGASTSVDFRVDLLLGMAGRVRTGEAIAADRLRIVIEDGSGRRLRDVAPNDFGYYRVDGLTPGSYRLRLLLDDAEVGTATATLSNDFLFNQDFVLDSAPQPAQRNDP